MQSDLMMGYCCAEPDTVITAKLDQRDKVGVDLTDLNGITSQMSVQYLP